MKKALFILVIISFFSKSEINAQTATEPAGAGTSTTDPYLIASLENLYWVSTQNFLVPGWSRDKYFKQIANIDASSTATWTNGWIPIGAYTSETTSGDASSSANSFFGYYDGGGFEINGLTIHSVLTNSQAGLFGGLGSNAGGYSTYVPVIINVRLTNVDFNIRRQKSGALVGHIFRGKVINCSSSGTLISTNSQLGGLVGQCQSGGTIQACYSTCTVTSTNSTIGGLVALNQGTVLECYSNGSVRGTSNVGGLVGEQSSSGLSFSYSNSSVSSSNNSISIGGITGIARADFIANYSLFWNSSLIRGGIGTYSSTGFSNGSSGNGKATEVLKIRGTFSSSETYIWDFAGETSDGSRDVWSFGSDGFPTVSVGTNYWKGSSTDWSATGNWSKGVVPAITSFDTTNNNSVIFPASLSNYPTLDSNVSLSSLTLASGASINLSSDTLTVSNILTNNGIITTASTGQVIVSSSGTLLGTGTLPETTISGTHSPGTSPGVQTFSGNLTYNAGSSINWELIDNTIGTRGTNYDGIDVTGNLNFAGATTLNLIFNGTGSSVDWDNTFWGSPVTGVNGWKLFEVSGTVSNLNNVTVTLSTAAIDAEGDFLSTVRGGSPFAFGLTQVGTGIYLTYAISTAWTGATNTDWSTSTNWNPIEVPTSSTYVYIPTGLSNYPVLSTNVSITELTLASGSSIDLSSFDLTLTGDFSNNGTISGSGILELNDSSLQGISGTGTVHNIKINNAAGVAIASGSNKLNVTGLYTPTSGVLTTNGNLVFRSTVTQEGVVGTAGTCPTEPISGDVTVEKYIPAKRAFRFITPGVTTSTTINANWQEGSSINSTSDYPYAGGTTENPTSGYGTHIMGTGGATNGFDLSLSNNASLFTFDVSSYAWVAEANTNDVSNVLKSGEGYRIFIRGDRSANLNTDVEDAIATTLRTKGVLKVCESVSFNTSTSVVPLNSTASRFTFIGNPYWSVVDWHAVTKSNVEDNVYYWDPTISGTNGRGAYITYNEITGNNTVGSAADRYIQPGQAFFVRNLSTVDGSNLPSITFEHADIVGSSPTRTAIFGKKNNLSAGGELGMDDQQRVRGTAPITIEKIYVSLLIKNKIAVGPADGFLVAYNQGFTDTYGREDAAKFSNLDENIAAVYNGSRQSILGLQSARVGQIKSDTIPISMTNLYDGEYLLKVSIDKSVSPVREVYVVNRVTKQQYKVDYTKGLELSFLNSITKTKDDLALVVNSQSIPNTVRTRKQLVVFPNPVTTGIVEVIVPNISGKMDMMNKPARIEVFSSNNQIVFAENVTLNAIGKATLDLSSLTSGGYVLRVYVDRNSFTTKLIKP